MRIQPLRKLDAEQMSTSDLVGELLSAKQMATVCSQKAWALSQQIPGLRTRLAEADRQNAVPRGQSTGGVAYDLRGQVNEARSELERATTEHRIWTGRVKAIRDELGILLEYWERAYEKDDPVKSYETSLGHLVARLLKEAVQKRDAAEGEFGQPYPYPEREKGEKARAFADRVMEWEHRQRMGAGRSSQIGLMAGLLHDALTQYGARVARHLQARMWAENLLPRDRGYVP